MRTPPQHRGRLTNGDGQQRVPLTTPSAVGVPLDAEDWNLLLSSRANVLVVASQAVTDSLLSVWLPHLQEPIYWWDAGAALAPAPEVQTVILDDIGRLSPAQQSAAFGLVVGRQHRFISLSRQPLYDLVLQRKFADDLYYLLNAVCLRL